MGLLFLAEMVIVMTFHCYLLFYTDFFPSPAPLDPPPWETALPALAFALGLLAWALVLDPADRLVRDGPLQICTVGLVCFMWLQLAQWTPWCMLRALQWSPVLALAFVAWGAYRKWTGAGERFGVRWERAEEVGPFRVDALFGGAGPVMVREVWNGW
ncbi:hypothetical protein CTA1_465 [Colletotrichum tanaceti]|uniref:Uncharacterized protein n=1 Tax=Colletotrichum tanaceti TaxID=1306861 RepID=A0A4U6XJ67_9PEZI|nr:hypothetical protein CTA1_465 [Colletotrichum tanaceti]